MEARDAHGVAVARTFTGERGDFSFAAPPSVREIVAASFGRIGNEDLAVWGDLDTHTPFFAHQELPGRGANVKLVARDEGEDRVGSAFHILDTIMVGAERARQWSVVELPPLAVWWSPRNTSKTGYYASKRVGQWSVIELSSGANSGGTDPPDTDEHDEGVILHEFGHFVMDHTTGLFAMPAPHGETFPVEPGLSWEEARANWFACGALGQPMYLDTVGYEPDGSALVVMNCERSANEFRGLGSEIGDTEVLWDLSDGGNDIEDLDQDGIALGPAAILRAMQELADQPGYLGSMPTFLHYLVGVGLVREDDMRGMLANTGQPTELFDSNFQRTYPTDVEVPFSLRGAIRLDSLRHVLGADRGIGPSTFQTLGPLEFMDLESQLRHRLDGMNVYRIHLLERRMLRVVLDIRGDGTSVSGENVDVEIRTTRGELIASARGENQTESISVELSPGWYLVYARDGSGLSQVEYEIRGGFAPNSEPIDMSVRSLVPLRRFGG